MRYGMKASGGGGYLKTSTTTIECFDNGRGEMLQNFGLKRGKTKRKKKHRKKTTTTVSQLRSAYLPIIFTVPSCGTSERLHDTPHPQKY